MMMSKMKKNNKKEKRKQILSIMMIGYIEHSQIMMKSNEFTNCSEYRSKYELIRQCCGLQIIIVYDYMVVT